MDYRAAGVNVAEGRRAVARMSAAVTATHGPEVLGGFGSFAGMFALGSLGITDPVLVSGADGVGTKVELARAAGIWNTVGTDLVAMCVNDVLCHGAQPLFFLDYLAVDRLDAEQVAQIVEGVARGCLLAGCALLGGETAEMPGVYRPGRFDMAGFAVGVVERSKIIDGSGVRPGHALVGLASSGVHSNGFSLVRRLFPELEQLEGGADGGGEGHLEAVQTLRKRFLEPTRIYAAVLKQIHSRVPVFGIAHITGGGWEENLPRLLGTRQDSLQVIAQRTAVPVPPVFREISRRGVAEDEMYRTFNMGLGLALAVEPDRVSEVIALAADAEIPAWPIGEVASR